MKIGNEYNEWEQQTLKVFLESYRHTFSHPNSKILLSAAIIFGYGMQYSFPRHSVDDEAVKTATTKDHIHK